MSSGSAIFSPTEKPTCRSTEIDADSYHYARTPSNVRSVAVPLLVEHRRLSESHARKHRGGHIADNVSLFSSHLNKEAAEAATLETIKNVAEWSRRHKPILSASNREVAFFTNNSKEARCQPSLQLDGTLLNTTSLPKFLGVTIDGALSFEPHVTAVVSKAPNRCQVLTSLTSKRWGWRKDQLLKAYRALHLSVINCAAPAWQPWMAPTQLDHLKHCQNRALHIII